MNQMQNDERRVVWADLLRISACIMVVCIHTAGTYYYYYYYFEEHSTGWLTSIMLDSLGWFAVPTFIMLSGMFMLDPQRNVTLKSIYLHSIPKNDRAYSL